MRSARHIVRQSTRSPCGVTGLARPALSKCRNIFQGKHAVYPYTEVDSKGQKLTGANKYTVSFPKDATPPVNGFWSITM